MKMRFAAALAALLLGTSAASAGCADVHATARQRAVQIFADGVTLQDLKGNPNYRPDGSVEKMNQTVEGVIISPTLVLASFHGQRDASSIVAVTADGTRYRMRTVMSDLPFELSLLEITRPDVRTFDPQLPRLKIASTTPLPGEVIVTWAINQRKIHTRLVMNDSATRASFYVSQLTSVFTGSGAAIYTCEGELAGILVGFKALFQIGTPEANALWERLNREAMIFSQGGQTKERFKFLSENLGNQIVRPEMIRTFVCGYDSTALEGCLPPEPPSAQTPEPPSVFSSAPPLPPSWKPLSGSPTPVRTERILPTTN